VGQKLAVWQDDLQSQLSTFLVPYQTLDPVSSRTIFADFSKFCLGSRDLRRINPVLNNLKADFASL